MSKISSVKYLLSLWLVLVIYTSGICQTYSDDVSFVGSKTTVISTTKIQSQGKLSTGEPISSGCDHGACFFKILYKGRYVTRTLDGDSFSNLKIYEYDFGGDEDKELVVVVEEPKINKRGKDEGETIVLKIYRYSKGQIMKIFEKEINTYRTIIKKNYIEYYIPSGLDTIWHYYLGSFYEMKPVDIKSDY